MYSRCFCMSWCGGNTYFFLLRCPECDNPLRTKQCAFQKFCCYWRRFWTMNSRHRLLWFLLYASLPVWGGLLRRGTAERLKTGKTDVKAVTGSLLETKVSYLCGRAAANRIIFTVSQRFRRKMLSRTSVRHKKGEKRHFSLKRCTKLLPYFPLKPFVHFLSLEEEIGGIRKRGAWIIETVGVNLWRTRWHLNSEC